MSKTPSSTPASSHKVLTVGVDVGSINDALAICIGVTRLTTPKPSDSDPRPKPHPLTFANSLEAVTGVDYPEMTDLLLGLLIDLDAQLPASGCARLGLALDGTGAGASVGAHLAAAAARHSGWIHGRPRIDRVVFTGGTNSSRKRMTAGQVQRSVSRKEFTESAVSLLKLGQLRTDDLPVADARALRAELAKFRRNAAGALGHDSSRDAHDDRVFALALMADLGRLMVGSGPVTVTPPRMLPPGPGASEERQRAYARRVLERRRQEQALDPAPAPLTEPPPAARLQLTPVPNLPGYCVDADGNVVPCGVSPGQRSPWSWT